MMHKIVDKVMESQITIFFFNARMGKLKLDQTFFMVSVCL